MPNPRHGAPGRITGDRYGFVRPLTKLQNKLPRLVKDHLMILRRRDYWAGAGIIFVHIPKAGGTSVSSAVYGRSLGHLRARDIRRVYPRLFARVPVFAVSRNPWARLVSAYEFARQGGTMHAGIRRNPVYQSPAFRSFQAFVEEWLVEQRLEQLDYVFQPQHLFVGDRHTRVIVDFVGKAEAMADVEAYLTEAMGRRIRIGRQNVSARSADYREYYANASLANRVGDLYRLDVEAFGYDL